MWQTGLSIDREIRSSVQVSAGYDHTWYGNYFVLDNTLVSPSDFGHTASRVRAIPGCPLKSAASKSAGCTI